MLFYSSLRYPFKWSMAWNNLGNTRHVWNSCLLTYNNDDLLFYAEIKKIALFKVMTIEGKYCIFMVDTVVTISG